MWMRRCGEFMNTTLRAAVRLGNDFVELYILPEISPNEHWNSNSMWRKSWSEITKKSKAFPLSTGNKSLGRGHPCLPTGESKWWVRRPTYSPTRCCVWEKSVTIPSKLGRRRSTVFKILMKVKSWIESMESRRSLSGRVSKDTLRRRPSKRFKSWWLKPKSLPEQFQGRIMSMSMYSVLVWEQNGNKELCVANSNKVTEYTKKIRTRSLVVSRARIRHEMVWNSYVQTEWRMGPSCWRDAVDILYFVDPVLWKEETWRSKGKDKTTIPFQRHRQTVEVILRTIISVNHLNVYGAVADMCDELARDTSKISESTGKLVAQNDLETMVTPSELSTINSASSTNEKAHSNLLRECVQKITILPDHSQLTKLCSNASLAKTGKGQYFTTTDETELDIWKLHVESTRWLEVTSCPTWKDWFVETRKLVQFLKQLP